MAKRIPNTQTGSLTNNHYGTNDKLTSSGGTLYGDAANMYNASHGGNDTLIGADIASNSSSFLVGDAGNMYNASHGGNDTLTGGANAGINASSATPSDCSTIPSAATTR